MSPAESVMHGSKARPRIDATRLGRKRAIQLLEHLDRIGLLRRVGGEHRVRSDCELFDQVRA